MPIEYNYSLIPANLHRNRPDVVGIQLGIIPGGFFGEADDVPVANLRVSGGQAMLELNTVQAALASRARPLTRSAAWSGWRVEPAGTRFGRISSIALTSDSPPVSSGFVDTATRHTLMLTYFDRPCHVWGKIVGLDAHGAEQGYDVDVTVAQPGLVWLDLAPEANPHSREIHRALTSPAPVVIAWVR